MGSPPPLLQSVLLVYFLFFSCSICAALASLPSPPFDVVSWEWEPALLRRRLTSAKSDAQPRKPVRRGLIAETSCGELFCIWVRIPPCGSREGERTFCTGHPPPPDSKPEYDICGSNANATSGHFVRSARLLPSIRRRCRENVCAHVAGTRCAPESSFASTSATARPGDNKLLKLSGWYTAPK